jgi:endonuclease G
MARSFGALLKQAVAEVERSDAKLADEFRAVRGERGRTPTNELTASLESLRPRRDVDDFARETIVLRTGRPVLAVVNDAARLQFEDADSEVWRERLTSARDLLARAIRAAGRIEVENHDLDWLGTGWLVADDIVVTNRHVASEFARRRGDGFVMRQGFGGRMAARIDFREEIGGTEAREFRLSEVLHVEDEDGPDVAFLRVEQVSGDSLATPIPLSRTAPKPRQQVAVIGYPARDSRIPDQDLMEKIFGNVFDKKRLAPGQVKGLEGGLLLHDCSTLGGNSGSVVLDLDSGEALALHFSGRFLVANFAVPAQTVGELLRGVQEGTLRRVPPRGAASRSGSVSTTALRTTAPRGAASVDATSTSITVPLRIRVELGPAETDDSQPHAAAAARRGKPRPETDEGEDLEDEELLEEGRPEDYADREGYRPDFLGVDVPLPGVDEDGDVLTFLFDGKKERELKYQHFTVVMSRSRRLCRYSAVNIDGGQSRKGKRPRWRTDPRIDREAQIEKECYGNEPRFARGHMTRREDPIWGAVQTASRGNSDSMHVTNAVPQMQPFNAGIWLGLENYALENAREDDMKISVITGPVLRDDDPIRFGVQIPVTFWKVIAFIHDETGEPSVTGYTLSQEGFLREEEFVFGRHETAQVPLALIETLAGVSFASGLRRLDPLERVHEARPRPLRDFRQIRFR